MELRPNFAKQKVEVRIQPAKTLMEQGRDNQPTTINGNSQGRYARGARGVEIVERGMGGVLYRIVCLLLLIKRESNAQYRDLCF